MITATVSVGGEVAGFTAFGNHLLGASISPDASSAPRAPGDDIAVSGSIAELDSTTDLGPAQRTGVPASLTLAIRTPAGEVRRVPGAPIRPPPMAASTASSPAA